MNIIKIISFFTDISFCKFLLVGIFNTVIGAVIMLLFYNTGNGYWFSSAISYLIAGIMSFFLNRYFTFASNTDIKRGLAEFFILLAVCYFIAYSLAKPVVFYFLQSTDYSYHVKEQVAMFAGMGFYSILNYLGQKLWVFKN